MQRDGLLSPLPGRAMNPIDMQIALDPIGLSPKTQDWPRPNREPLGTVRIPAADVEDSISTQAEHTEQAVALGLASYDLWRSLLPSRIGYLRELFSQS